MKQRSLLAQLSIVSACMIALASANAAEHIILTNGQFYTTSGWKEAVAISDGVIIEIGDAQSIAKLRTGATRVIDLGGDAVLPGLHDSHVHIAGAGLTRLQCRVAQNATGREFLDFVAGCARARKAGEWIIGGQYSAAAFGNQRPNKKLLDTVAPNNPAIMGDISGHSSWVNTRALQLAGITRDTPDPAGGVIERDAKGEPTGLLHETAAGLVRRIVPPYTLEQTTQAIEWSLKLMLSYGITTAVDAGLSEPILPAFRALADQGKLKQRVHGCIRWSDRNASSGSMPLADSLRLIETRNLYARERFMPNCVKIVLDGVPTDSHTAAMLDAYVPTHDAEHGANDKGLLMIAPEVLHPAVTWMDAHGLTVKFHAAGDAAVRAGLDAIAAARAANGFSGTLHDVGHNSFVNPDDIKRARAMGAVFEFSPYIWFPSPIIRDIRKAVGEARMKRWIPVKDALDAGAPSVAGSDWSVVPSVNPWIALETLVTRQAPGGQGEVLGGSQRVTLEQALDLFTSAPAVRMGTRNRVGAIEKGLFADLIVLDRNPFKTPIGEVHKTKVKRVFINGELVFEDAT
jgi:predicted amidohydrolase YtcJ